MIDEGLHNYYLDLIESYLKELVSKINNYLSEPINDRRSTKLRHEATYEVYDTLKTLCLYLDSIEKDDPKGRRL